MGYSIQGLFKFGLYEVFKHYIGSAVGEEKMESGIVKSTVFMAASASAEFFADLAYCPFEVFLFLFLTFSYLFRLSRFVSRPVPILLLV